MSTWFATTKNGDALQIQQLLNTGTQDINEKDQETALHIATRNSEKSVIRILLRNGADINSTIWNTGETPLHIAIQCHDSDIALLLIEKGADIQLTMKNETPLHMASKIGDIEVVESLLESGAKLNELDNKGNTPLHLATEKEHLAIIRLLLSRREELLVDISNNDNFTPMDIACKYGNLLILQELSQVFDGGLPDPILSIKYGHLHITLWLLEKGSIPKDPQLAFKEFIFLHLFHSCNEYSNISKKRKRSTSLNTQTPPKKQKISNDIEIINLDLISSQDEEDLISSPLLSNTLSSQKDSSNDISSTIYGVSLEETTKILSILLKQINISNIDISLEQHLQAFIIPLIQLYKSSQPSIYQSIKNILDTAGFKGNTNVISNNSINKSIIESIEYNKGSLLEGNYSDTRQAAEDMNINLEHLQEILSLLQLKKQLILRGPPGTGKSFIVKNLASRLITEKGSWEMVQFHQNYAYEDFMMGFRPISSQYSMSYELHDGPMICMIKKALDNPKEIFVMIIDELNRGNVCQIFGELFYLLDDRNGKVNLQYTSEKIQLPNNLYILATMNTADRSIAILDDALMRRFHFIDLHDINNTDGIVYNAFKNWYSKTGRDPSIIIDDLFIFLNNINEIIDSPDKNVGPSYFMKDNIWPKESNSDIINEQCKLNMNLTWKYSILPYIYNTLTLDGISHIKKKLTDIWNEFQSKINKLCERE